MTPDIAPRHYARSSSFQMAVLFTLVCGLAVLAFATTVLLFQRERVSDEIDAVIQSDLFFIDHLLNAHPIDDVMAQISTRQDRIYRLFDARKPPDFLRGSMPRMAEGTLLTIDDAGRWVAGRIHTLPDGAYLFIGLDVHSVIETYDRIRFLSWVCIAGMLMVIVLSFAISVFVVSGTNKINRTAAKIMRTGDLSARIAVRSRWDDLSFMAATLNAMLDRIEHLTNGVRLVANGIAHDLRTPLARLRGRLEQMERCMAHDLSNPLLCHARDALAETDGLLRTFNALLRIGRIETGRERHGFLQVDLQALVRDAVDLYHPLFDEKSIHVVCDTQPVSVMGDRDLLFQLFVNVLDNAEKYTPAGGTVRLMLMPDDRGQVKACVFNSGSRVDDQALKRLGERFYRGETPPVQVGSGLGLALVRAIADLHGWSIHFTNHPTGFEVMISTGVR